MFRPIEVTGWEKMGKGRTTDSSRLNSIFFDSTVLNLMSIHFYFIVVRKVVNDTTMFVVRLVLFRDRGEYKVKGGTWSRSVPSPPSHVYTPTRVTVN